MPAKGDSYKRRKEIEAAVAKENNTLLYGFFGMKPEPIGEVQQRLNKQLQATEINKMLSEIAELNATTN